MIPTVLQTLFLVHILAEMHHETRLESQRPRRPIAIVLVCGYHSGKPKYTNLSKGTGPVVPLARSTEILKMGLLMSCKRTRIALSGLLQD